MPARPTCAAAHAARVAWRPLRHVALLAALAGVYFITGKLGLQLAFVHASATAVWPPTGIALAAFLLFGYRAWPGIAIGAFLVNLSIQGAIATSVGISIGNTLEGVVGAYLVNRFADGRDAFERARSALLFVLCAALLGTAVSATCGVTSLSLGGFADRSDFGPIWLTWWLGDVSGALTVTPVAVLWWKNPRVSWSRQETIEAGFLLLGLIVVTMIVFGGIVPAWIENDPFAFLSFPFLIWAALVFGPREAATAVLVLAGVSIWGTLQGHGPFARGSQNASLLLLQSFVAVTAVMSMTLAAVVSERERVQERLRQLAITDPVTGLANYRQLILAFDREIERSRRTKRPFSVLFFDVDDLKLVNDRYGHLAGTAALCRLADLLRRSSRTIDTAARFGGDEFALILPESDESAARHVAHRVAEQLRADGEHPPLSVSVGIAIFPDDGETPEALLSSADRLLYEAKARGGGGLPPNPEGRR